MGKTVEFEEYGDKKTVILDENGDIKNVTKVVARVIEPNEKFYKVKESWTDVRIITEWLVLAPSEEEAERIACDQNANPKYYCKSLKWEEKIDEGDYEISITETDHLGEKNE